MRAVLVVMLAYLIGSIPFGYLIVRLSGRGDVRETGSGGTGATNVSRRAGKGAGALTLVLDALKGAAAVLIATRIASGWVIAAAATVVVVGHIFPVWLGFRGGKGVATAVGVFLILAPFALLVAGVVFLLLFLITRYVSLGSIAAAATIPIILSPNGLTSAIFTCAAVVAALVIFAHRANISRLINGTEPKFS
ncbi:MAG TPA: glycerol-3-phosphate 1-O-acyltransferase PlsY [Pyrinomonadaceae bacterium]|nr:glycerol-3-phosphate 1-O-acyltransferase PlsY [Pyrinomonadaceae bacterium]